MTVGAVGAVGAVGVMGVVGVVGAYSVSCFVYSHSWVNVHIHALAADFKIASFEARIPARFIPHALSWLRVIVLNYAENRYKCVFYPQ